MNALIPPPTALSRHAGSPGDKLLQDRRDPYSPVYPMAELARALIRQQWPLRHHADPIRRAQARTLIRTHILLLRKWQAPAAMAR
jgi:hypothetical protein